MIHFFERLDKFMEIKGLNDNKITVEAGISVGLIGKARKRGALSQDNISKILHVYRELDANWLFLGEGEMLKKDAGVSTIVAEAAPAYGVDGALVAELRSQNAQQRCDIEWLKKELDKKQQMIDTLLSGSVTFEKSAV